MESNQLLDFDYSCDYFLCTKFFPAGSTRKTMRLPRHIWNNDGSCKLDNEERKAPSFNCSSCGEFVLGDIKKELQKVISRKLEERA